MFASDVNAAASWSSGKRAARLVTEPSLAVRLRFREPRLRGRSEAVQRSARRLELLLSPDDVAVRERFQPVSQRQRWIRFLRLPECLSRIVVLEAVQQRDTALKCRLRRFVPGVLEVYRSERVGMRCLVIGLPCDGRCGQTGNQRESGEFHGVLVTAREVFASPGLTGRPTRGASPIDERSINIDIGHVCLQCSARASRVQSIPFSAGASSTQPRSGTRR